MRIALLLLFGATGWSAAGAQVSALVSQSSQASATASAGSYQPVLSGDGRYVAFASPASDLVVPPIGSGCFNVFVGDRITGNISLVSVATNGTSGGDDNSLAASLSADGRYVAFQSSAGNLATNDTNSTSDIFLRDQLAGTTVLASRQRDGWTAPGKASIAPLISADGRRLVFESTAPNLVVNDTNNASDIFLFDRVQKTVSLVSLNGSGTGSRAGASVAAAMTPDGKWVAYVNYVSNIFFGFSPTGHVYVRNLETAVTTQASSAVPGQFPGFVGAFSPVFSAQGQAVYFYASNNGFTNLYRYDLTNHTTVLVASQVQGTAAPSPSSDGQKVAFERSNYVMIWDAATMNSVTGSVNQAGEPIRFREGVARPILSADGTKVTFLSNARLSSVLTNGMAQLYQRDLVSGVTRLLSADTNGVASGDLSAVAATITADGAVVAFETTSTQMVPDDLNAAPDVFVTEVSAGTHALISKNGNTNAPTPLAAAMLYPGSLSQDGRFVAYGSADLGPVIGDTNGMQDIFVRDLQTGSLRPVSVDPTGVFTNQFHSQNCVLSASGGRVVWMITAPGYFGYSSIFWRDLNTGEIRLVSDMSGNGGARNAAPTMSPDGRWVAFESTRPTHFIESGVVDQNSGTDIILQDVIAGTNTVISRSVAGAASGNGVSFGPMFSPDGRWLAFGSKAGNLTTNASGAVPRLFVRDLVNNVTIDTGIGPYQGNGGLPPTYAGRAIFSGDSRYIAYNAPSYYVGLYDLSTNLRSNVCNLCNNPALSGDGRWLAVSTLGVSFGGSRVRLLDRVSGKVSYLGTNVVSGVFPGDLTRDPVLGRDGRYLVFLANRPFGSSLSSPTLYVRDLLRGSTMPLPVDVHGGVGNAGSYIPQLAADGRTLVFASFASDLAAGDNNGRRDVFAFKLAGTDADQDGLDDEWEVAYFTNLSADGTGDFDQDGQSDREEFVAGTDPTNGHSVLSVMLVTDLLANQVTVIWNSVPGRTYDVQFKNSVTDTWSTLFAGVVADGPSRYVVDNLLPRPNHRFYRVVFQP